MIVAQELPVYALIGGRRCSGGAGTFEVRSPLSGGIVNHVARCDARDVDRAVRAARESQPGWLALSGAERGALLRRVNELFVERADAIAHMITAETGKTIMDTRAEVIEQAAPAYLRTAITPPTPMGRPTGVIGVISPTAFPASVASIAIANALSAGNVVVWKPSEHAPTSCAMVGDLFEHAGFPAGVVNVVHGLADVAAAIVRHRDVEDIFFSGPSLTRNRSTIVPAGADIDAAVDLAVRGALVPAGEGSAAAGPLVVHQDVHDEFATKLKTRAANLHLGPLASRQTRERVIDDVDDAWTRGAEVHQYGRDDFLFHPATIITGVTPDMSIAQANTPGPVAPIVKVSTIEGARAHTMADDSAASWQIVLADADIDAAVDAAVFGCFRLPACGRIAAARLLVHADVHDEFAASLGARAGELLMGDPFDENTDIGPLNDEATREGVIDQVDDAWTRGAEVVQHGRSEGLFYPATIVTGVDPDTRVACSKTFGPVAAIVKIATVEEAIAMVNRCEPGFTATLWTTDSVAAERITAALWPGTATINKMTDAWGQMWPCVHAG